VAHRFETVAATLFGRQGPCGGIDGGPARFRLGQGAAGSAAQWPSAWLRFGTGTIVWNGHGPHLIADGTSPQGVNSTSMFNFIRTGVLLAVMTALFMAVGYFIGGTSGMMVAFGVALVTNLLAYWNADKLVLGLQGARPVDPRSAPDLYRMVERLAGNAGLPMPKV